MLVSSHISFLCNECTLLINSTWYFFVHMFLLVHIVKLILLSSVITLNSFLFKKMEIKKPANLLAIRLSHL
jgi:hypothetical protein